MDLSLYTLFKVLYVDGTEFYSRPTYTIRDERKEIYYYLDYTKLHEQGETTKHERLGSLPIY